MKRSRPLSRSEEIGFTVLTISISLVAFLFRCC